MPTFAFLSLCAVPFLWVFLRAICSLIFDKNYFGADPGMELVTFFGQAGIVFLFITLSFSHLRRPLKNLAVPRMRRILGLSVFFYATLHLARATDNDDIETGFRPFHSNGGGQELHRPDQLKSVLTMSPRVANSPLYCNVLEVVL